MITEITKPGGWIGVDLDGTLARYDVWVSELHIGEPIHLMAERVRKWLDQGIEVRIFTARVDGGMTGSGANAMRYRDVERVRKAIQDWTEDHFGVRLKVTNVKDYNMMQLWDDRAVGVEKNTGRIYNVSGD